MTRSDFGTGAVPPRLQHTRGQWGPWEREGAGRSLIPLALDAPSSFSQWVLRDYAREAVSHRGCSFCVSFSCLRLCLHTLGDHLLP
jgi:hypothetical protein